ncbi:protein of unknown function [Thermanaeromonas toyohensis ToBE]|uniref:DUF3854 domain-containing protein n=1 Tax=Thermanaeromonas toyohensis ToBE TaxID=698762 RepID=A0A1W1VVH4_9FIRM|nr:DUF3854 domain-containing protein [Thermanaeromonas toyohensis]SMB96864.1 protein of unknown function [Thermanaeromonas toyohensis ToBE]
MEEGVKVLDADVLMGLDLRPAGRDERRGNCPACGDTKGHLYLNLRKGVYYCHRCGFSGKIRDGFLGCDWQGMPPLPEENVAPVEVLDRVYRLLFQHLPLSREHREQLLRRGLPEEKHRQYATLPAEGRRDAVRAVIEVTDPSGVPGFCVGDRGWYLSGPPGLLIPVKNFEGKIWGVQVRVDDPGDGGKYRWLSSRKGRGPKAKVRYHVAAAGDMRRVWVTEGPLKADVAAHFLGETVIAVPGVNTWASTGLVDAFRGKEVKEAIIAYDMDLQANVHVAKASLALGKEIFRAGLKVRYAWWNPQYKGLDDLLNAGGSPEVISVREYKDRLRELSMRGGQQGMVWTHGVGWVAAKPVLQRRTNKKTGQTHDMAYVVVWVLNKDKEKLEAITLTAWGKMAHEAVALEKGQFITFEGVWHQISAYDAAGNVIPAAQCFLTKIVRLPEVPEVGGNGNFR